MITGLEDRLAKHLMNGKKPQVWRVVTEGKELALLQDEADCQPVQVRNWADVRKDFPAVGLAELGGWRARDPTAESASFPESS